MKYRFWSVEKKAVLEQGRDETQDNRFVKLVNSIIRFAVQKKASDIHFEVLNPEKCGCVSVLTASWSQPWRLPKRIILV